MSVNVAGSIEYRLYVALLRFMQRVRELSVYTATTLNLSEGQILGEVQSKNAWGVLSLSQVTGIEKSAVSRLVTGLRKRRFLKIDVGSKRDGRFKHLALTESGALVLAQDDQARSTVSRAILSSLTSADQDAVQKLFASLATGFGKPPSEPRENEHPLRPSQRRLTQAFGLLGGDFLGSGMSICALHVFRLSVQQPGQLDAQYLNRILPYDQSTIARAIKMLTDRRYLEHSSPPADRRRKILFPTHLGERELKKIEQAMERKFTNALGNAATEMLEISLASLEYAVQHALLHPELPELRSRQKSEFAMKELIVEEELQAARALLIQHLIRLPAQLLPTTLLDRKSKCFGYYRKTSLVALAEINEELDRASLSGFFCFDEGLQVEKYFLFELSDYYKKNSRPLWIKSTQLSAGLVYNLCRLGDPVEDFCFSL
jgi:DNA-binding MarR family transcriptional regulator